MKKFLPGINQLLNNTLKWAPTFPDALILSIFTILVTFQPYYLHRVVDYFELAIYLPGINALLNGAIPYKDFFHLRGPLELYVPAFFMNLFGRNISILYTYFYAGTIATLVIWILIGKEIFQKRIILYFFTLVLVARTFPRVVFQIWGGMRFGLGALAMLCILYFLKKNRSFWLILSGIISSLALLTSIEIGVFNFFAVFALAVFSLIFKIFNIKDLSRFCLLYTLGVLLVLVPYGILLYATQSLMPFIDTVLSVTQNMTTVFPDYLYEDHPRTLFDAIYGLIPSSKHFKHLTPSYCYIFFTIFIAFKMRKQKLTPKELGPLAVAFYGFIMYVFAFRKIGAAQFEMALQPEKMLLFVMLEEAYIFCIERKKQLLALRTGSTNKKIQTTATAKITGINILLFLFIGSSAGYPLQRMNHRFIAFKYGIMKITGQDTNQLRPEGLVPADIETAQGLYIPEWQNNDFNDLKRIIHSSLKEDEVLFTFPDGGIYNFLLNRPFVGKFPVMIFSWMNDDWSEQLFAELKKAQPKYVIVPKKIDPVFEKVYFKIEKNKENYNKFFRYIEDNYIPADETHSLKILKRKETR